MHSTSILKHQIKLCHHFHRLRSRPERMEPLYIFLETLLFLGTNKDMHPQHHSHKLAVSRDSLIEPALRAGSATWVISHKLTHRVRGW